MYLCALQKKWMKRGVISAEEKRGSQGYPAEIHLIHRRDLQNATPGTEMFLLDEEKRKWEGERNNNAK